VRAPIATRHTAGRVRKTSSPEAKSVSLSATGGQAPLVFSPGNTTMGLWILERIHRCQVPGGAQRRKAIHTQLSLSSTLPDAARFPCCMYAARPHAAPHAGAAYCRLWPRSGSIGKEQEPLSTHGSSSHVRTIHMRAPMRTHHTHPHHPNHHACEAPARPGCTRCAREQSSADMPVSPTQPSEHPPSTPPNLAPASPLMGAGPNIKFTGGSARREHTLTSQLPTSPTGEPGARPPLPSRQLGRATRHRHACTRPARRRPGQSRRGPRPCRSR